ncbi:conserved hypothetical protein [Micromonospora sp. ATCC 39149]|nr:conserved hypothetical protein [Micromonospora sp. ATCC 39149]
MPPPRRRCGTTWPSTPGCVGPSTRRRARSDWGGTPPGGPGGRSTGPRSGCAPRGGTSTRPATAWPGSARLPPTGTTSPRPGRRWPGGPTGRRRGGARTGRGWPRRSPGRRPPRRPSRSGSRASSPPPGWLPGTTRCGRPPSRWSAPRPPYRRLVERRAQAAELREQRAGHERQARVARALAGHLRANNFERWLLAEALDLLVDGASGILRELSGGQYDLVHDKGEFFVVDHHDAGLRRGVRTLSGGETFQASLALALALSEQLAGMSTTAATLESIVLDEGFGTLDTATLDTVAATLESLAARGDRMVGVVTHVPALAERIPVRFEVSKDARTARVLRTGR